MARLRRLDLPRVPQHVIVRGVNRQACFRAPGDYAAYLDDLALAANTRDCAIHAYVLMTNHVHLLVTGNENGAVSAMMQQVGRRYVPRFNASWGRTGTLYQGRFRASLVDTDRYLLTCMRYIEMNPVRAGMVATAFEYRWSSVHANTRVRDDPLVTPHSQYCALGGSEAERAAAYRLILAQPLSEAEVDNIRRHVNAGCALGDANFQAQVAQTCGRRADPRPSGPVPRVERQRATPGLGDDLW